VLHYHSTPVFEIREHPAIEKAGVRLLVKREDLNHPTVPGNKWWKLKYNLAAASETVERRVVTFGGAFSNHIYAVAAATGELKLEAVGLIRGEETLPLNPTLQYALKQGMKIHYLSRGQYREKASPVFLKKLQHQFGNFYLIPEGGSNRLAVKGCAEFADKELSQIDFQYLFLPVGTGGTLAGLVCGLKETKQVVGVSVLKGGDFLKDDVLKMMNDFSGKRYGNWTLLSEYHHGGYAKTTPEFLLFMQEMKAFYQLPLDHVYTGKMMWAVMREIERGSFSRGTTLLALHTGGLQTAGI
jgi:1-aminocyclopropane-1-carboxylate deaminase